MMRSLIGCSCPPSPVAFHHRRPTIRLLHERSRLLALSAWHEFWAGAVGLAWLQESSPCSAGFHRLVRVCSQAALIRWFKHRCHNATPRDHQRPW